MKIFRIYFSHIYELYSALLFKKKDNLVLFIAQQAAVIKLGIFRIK